MPPSPPSAATGRRRPSSPSVSVVIPVRDPAGLPLILRGLPAVDEVVLVADGQLPQRAGVVGPDQQDGPAAAARAACPDAVLVHPGRPGPGAALACGIAAARGDVVVTLNGDGSTDPAEIPRFVAALVAGADVVLGSRYRDGGRDLTGSRFARWADLLLIWCVNAVFGTGRTDPGFGYAAFWRDAAARLDLPGPDAGPARGEGAASGAGSAWSDGAASSAGSAWGENAASDAGPVRGAGPASGAGPVWGDGPEIGPLLAIRPAARGLVVAEVASVAHPPIRHVRDADRARLRHWLRVAFGEYARSRSGRHAAEPVGRTARGYDPAGHTAQGDPAGRTAHGYDPAGGDGPDAGAARRTPGGRTSVAPDDRARRWQQADRRAGGQPIWAPARRRPAPGNDLWLRAANSATPSWRAGHPEPLGGPDVQPRPTWATGRPAGLPEQNTPRPDAAGRRRRAAGLRQQPDLRVINGEGDGKGTGRRARLRAVEKNGG